MSYAPRETHKASEPTTEQTEAPGPIAADSLAADSIRSGGDFGANEAHQPTPMGVKGASSTLANTDTSGAVPLHAAVDREAREKQDAKGLGSDERGVTGVRYPDAGMSEATGTTTSEGHYYGAPSGRASSGGYSTGAAAGASDFGATTFGSDTGATSATGGLPSTSTSGGAAMPTPGSGAGAGAGAGVRPYVPEGPTYTARVAGNLASEGEFQPKGQNLTEGGVPETKTFLGDVGGPNDPGRLAERSFEQANAEVAGGGVAGGRSYQDGKENDKGGFEVLGSERA